MSRDDEDAAFADYAAARWLTLVRAAVSLGCSLADAEDLAQTTLVRCYVAWSKVTGATHRDAYVSKILVNTHRDSHRRRWRRETPVPELPDVQLPDETALFDTADVLRRALSGLSQGQREVIALRYYVRLTEPQIAEALDVAPGTVKSRLSRALAQLSRDDTIADLRGGRT